MVERDEFLPAARLCSRLLRAEQLITGEGYHHFYLISVQIHSEDPPRFPSIVFPAKAGIHVSHGHRLSPV
jgi:hypothetical protein